MPDQLLIVPDFSSDANGQRITIDSGPLNALFKNEYTDTFDYYQSVYNVFGWMPLRRNREFVIHRIQGSPLLWQPHNSCSWDALGQMTVPKESISPTPLKLNHELCYDEYINSAFETLLQYNGSGPIELGQDETEIMNAFADELLTNAKIGLDFLYAGGGLYDVDTLGFQPGIAADIQSIFKASYGSFVGWLKGLSDASAISGKAQLNAASVDLSGTVNILTQVDNLKAAAKPKLQRLINSGGIRNTRRGGAFVPTLIVSDSLFAQVISSYNAQAQSAAMNDPRIRREAVTSNVFGAPAFQYFVDTMPVVPLTSIGGFDEWVDVETRFMGIWASGAVQLGGSFDSLPSLANDNVAMQIQRSERNEDYGKTTFLSHALAGLAFPDTDYIVAKQLAVV